MEHAVKKKTDEYLDPVSCQDGKNVVVDTFLYVGYIPGSIQGKLNQ